MYLSYMLAQYEKDSGFTTNTASININGFIFILLLKLSVRKHEKTEQNNSVPKTLTFKSILTRSHWHPHYDHYEHVSLCPTQPLTSELVCTCKMGTGLSLPHWYHREPGAHRSAELPHINQLEHTAIQNQQGVGRLTQ